MRPTTSWETAEFWVCRQHMRGVRLPAAATESANNDNYELHRARLVLDQ